MLKYFFLFCVFLLSSNSSAQTYIYDKNLKAPDSLIKEASLIREFASFSPAEITSEFRSNPIRAEYFFKNKPIILVGKIALISQYKNKNYILFDVSENEFVKKHIFVWIENSDRYIKYHKFDKITNYSVGDTVSIICLYGGMNPDGTQRIFLGNLLHRKDLQNPKMNFMVKIVNLPDNLKLSYGLEDDPWFAKFSPIKNGKSYCKFFQPITQYSIMHLTISDNDDNVIKKTTLKVKTNCQSIFDYNKL